MKLYPMTRIVKEAYPPLFYFSAKSINRRDHSAKIGISMQINFKVQ